MNTPKDCKQLIIEKLKYQYWQENFYLNKINLTIQLAYAREEQNRIYEELLEVELAINGLINEQRREQAYELLIGHEYLLDEDYEYV